MPGLALLGGTFDPPHIGHLRAAIESVEALNLDELRFVPCALPAHRAIPGVSAADRAEMIDAAVSGQRTLRCDRRELSRPGPSYTVDTLQSVRDEVGNGTPLIWIVGADAFAGLASWHRWQTLFELAHLVVLTRPDAHALIDPRLELELAHRATSAPLDLRTQSHGLILRLQIPLLPISSSLIRERLAAGRSIAHLVPEPVCRMIDERGWYRRL